MTLWQVIGSRIAEVTGDSIGPGGTDSVGGGCINRAVRLTGAERDYFVKLNAAARLDMFEAEAAGLQEIADSGSLRVPRPLCWGVDGDSAYLVLEYVEFGRGGTSGLEALGRGLAAMHRVTRDRFGWVRDNTIGSTPQINTSGRDWTAFWRERRLGYQLELAARNGYGARGSVVRQLCHGQRRRPGDFRPGGVLWRPGDRSGHDRAVRRFRRPVLCGLS
ncbi:MAG: fructosamine kinase family protein [Gammaproteobacteria bacterium]